MFRSRWLVLVVILHSALSHAASTKTITVPDQSFTFCAAHVSEPVCFLPTFGLKNIPGIPVPLTLLFGTEVRISNLLGIESAGLPFLSPSAGVSFIYDPKLGVVTRSMESFGPILSDRADTLGRHRLAVGFSYEHFNFDRLENQSLNNLSGTAELLTKLNLRLDEFTTFLTYGLTSRMDVSAAIPVRTVHMSASGTGVTSLNLFTGAITFGPASDHIGASGLSDILVRAKGQVLKRENGGISLGIDLRTPTGEPLKFLGSGAFGAKPFIIASFAKKIGRFYVGPHFNTGFEWNGRSILAGELPGLEGRLPRRWVYAAGTELGVFKRTTLTADLIGEHLFSAERFYNFNFRVTPSTATITTKSVNLKDGSIGAKVNPWRNLLVTGNLTWRLDRGGLRARMVPLGGISYTF